MSVKTAAVHITYLEALSSVFLSQVARPMSRVQACGHRVTLVVFLRLGQLLRGGPRRQWQERRREIEDVFGLDVQLFLVPPSRASKLWSETALPGRWLRKRYRRAENVILHCRGTAATRLALNICQGESRFQVLSDCRGVDAPEFLMSAGYAGLADAPPDVHARYEQRATAQGHVLGSSDAVICVSEAMKRDIISEWSVEPGAIHVVPCSTEVTAGEKAAAGRHAMRSRLGLDECFVVAYCGSLDPWQMPKESLAVFRAIASLRPDAHFLAVTTDPVKMRQAVTEAGLDDERRTVVQVGHTDVPSYLAAADLGLLIRAPSPVNRVASPVKFAEYLACGVPVVLTEGIGDYSDLVRERRLGCVLKDLTVGPMAIEWLSTFLDEYDREAESLRQRCLATATAELGWDASIERVCGIYQTLSQQRQAGRPVMHG